jgi:hypothetical protein
LIRNSIRFLSSERKNEVILDEARNLIDTHVEKRRNVLIVNFVRQIQTDDALYDVDIGENIFFSILLLLILKSPK